MNWFWLNMPLAAVFFGSWVGVPLWLVVRRPDRDPAPLVRAPAVTRRAVAAEPQATPVLEGSGQPVGVLSPHAAVRVPGCRASREHAAVDICVLPALEMPSLSAMTENGTCCGR